MVEKRLGALPVVAESLRRLDVAGVVDGVCPGGASAYLSHGQMVEALVANRLTSPAPLVRVGDWARTWAVEEVFGIEPDLLNDDRPARAVTPEQIVTHSLPTAPPKATDRRSFSGTATTQAEALPPDMLAAIVHGAIEAHRDPEVHRQALLREETGRQAIRARLARQSEPGRPPAQ
ncbi:DUF4277 domain-containing protein [Streptomyces sp. NPDC018347]|uniref:DUF4277 domain-containing protein n=1 Tax=Streptomyces sp. NPDC018347 TaxID=3157193 RepID=UPI0033F978F0